MTSTLKEQAARYLKEGLAKRNGLKERQVERHLRNFLPNLTRELEESGDLEAYCQCQAGRAREQYLDLTDAGTPADVALELTRAEMFPTPEDEEEPDDEEDDVAE
jgi:hypothetical protein